MTWLVQIAGVDRTTSVQPFTGLSIESRAYEGSGVANIPIRVPDGSWAPAPDDTVRITYSGVELFEGFARAISRADVGYSTGPRLYVVAAQDFTTLLDDDVIETAFRSAVETDKARVTWLIQTFGTRGVTAGTEVQALLATMPVGDDGRPEQDFSGKTLREALEQVARLAGARFYVDYDKKLHWFASESNTAPFNLSDTPNGTTTKGYGDLQITDDSVDLIHKVLVVGTDVKVWRDLTHIGGGMPSAGNVRSGVISDSSITSTDQANAAGDAYLRKFGTAQRSGSLTTWEHGLRASMTFQLTHQGHGLSSAVFRINSVVAKPAGSRVVYAVAFGDERADLSSVVGGTQRQVTQLASSVTPTVLRAVADLQAGGGNLVKNSSFESGSDQTWTVGTEWVINYMPAGNDAFSGRMVARAAPSAATVGALTMVNRVPVDRTQDYWISAYSWMRSWTSGTARIQVKEFNAAGTLLATTTVADIAAAQTKWTRHSIRFGPNDQVGRTGFQATTASINVEFITTGSSTLQWEVDGVQIERGGLITAYAPAPYELVDGQIVGPEIADAAIASVHIGDDVITSPHIQAGSIDSNKLAANAVVAGKIAAGAITSEHINTNGLDAGLITSGQLRLGGVSDAPDILIVFDSEGEEIGRWDEDGLVITDAGNDLLKVRLSDGVLQFSTDGGVSWTTAMSGDGINADAIRLGTMPGGHNAVPNSGFEMVTGFVAESAKEWTSLADWQGHLASTDINVDDTGSSGNLRLTTATF